MEQTRDVKIQAYENDEVRREGVRLAVEAALEVVVNGKSHSLLMQTPGAEKELVVGYLYTEGLIESFEDVGGLEFDKGPEMLGMEGTRVQADLPGLNVEDGLPERPSISLASCGLCGKEDLEKLGRGVNRIKSRQRYSWSMCAGLLKDLRRRQPLYEETRGVHAVALYDSGGRFFCCYEDVGRHNALDKVIGRSLMQGWGFDDKLAVLSGRSSLEMILKSARAGLPLLICFSSPTALAVEAAKTLNLTLVGRQEKRYLAAFTHARRMVE